MDFNGPGTSLFQGGNLNDFETNVQREEEEEAIEDQRRRDIELKNILENAFDDVSFDNEECSGVLSLNHSNLTSHTPDSSVEQQKGGSNARSSVTEFPKPCAMDECHTPVRHSRSIRTKTLDFSNCSRVDNCSDQYRMKQQNGSLHDIVDASGGGDCMPMNYIKPDSYGEYGMEGIAAINARYQNAEYNSIEQLQILYEVRVREVHRLTELVDTMKNSHEMERNEYKRQLAIAAAELERQKMSQSDAEALVVASKEEIDGLRKEVELLRRKVSEVEESREQLLVELETCRATVNDLERKLLAIEKGRKDVTAVMQYEVNLREIKERHAAEFRAIQEEAEKWKKATESKTREADELRRRLAETSQARDEDLAKKSEVIQRLSKQVEEAQERCEKLMRNSLAEDNLKLQMEGKILREENGALVARVEALERNLAAQESEMKQYECLKSFDENAETDDINRRLREELFRALNSQKARRLELQALQALIKKKDEQIASMTEKEREFLAESARFREDMSRHIAELKNYETMSVTKEAEKKRLEEVLEEAKRDVESRLMAAEERCRELEREKAALREEMDTLRQDAEKERAEALTRYNDEYLRFHSDGLQRVREEVTESLKLELASKEVEIENLKREVEEVKNLYVDVYNEKERLLDVDEVKKLQKELEKSRQRILDMDLTLRQQYQQEVEKLNSEIKALQVETERLRKEGEYESTEKERLASEVEALRREVEEVTAEKNLHFLSCETLRREHEKDIQEVKTRYEIKVQKLNKEIELMLMTRSTESRHTSPMKSRSQQRTVAVQGSPVSVQSACTSPLRSSTKESSTSPVSDSSKTLSKREVVRMMEQLGARHEEEVNVIEGRHRLEMAKLDKKWREEVERLREEMLRAHAEEMDRIRERHRTEMINRIEHEKKEAVVGLITEWACEAQALKQAQAEAAAEVENLKVKYKSAKKLAQRYKAYFANKVEQMRGEWLKVEEGYEKALKELEKNIRALVDVREDEVKAKVESMTKVYEGKIERMRAKLEKYEGLLAGDGANAAGTSSRNSVEQEDDGRSSGRRKSENKSPEKGPEKLVVSKFVRGVKLKDVDLRLRGGSSKAN